MLFAQTQLPKLRSACEELSCLLSRGYSELSTQKLVGDRHAHSADSYRCEAWFDLPGELAAELTRAFVVDLRVSMDDADGGKGGR